jgi:hypothetical protein
MGDPTNRLRASFPQADVECDIHMAVPVGFDLKGRKKEFCLKLR